MIVTCINGGLGNQMFQYAAARSLADRLGEPLQLDLRDLDPASLSSRRKEGIIRPYGLGAYAIRAESANPVPLNLRGFWVSRRARNFLNGKGWLLGDFLPEQGFTYREIQAKPGRFTYLEGYWQSWKYFEWNRRRIVEDLTLRRAASGRNAQLLKKIASQNSVCLHVRLGDYVRSAGTAAAHGNLTPAYYRAALGKVGRFGPRPAFYLFSDEPAVALKLLKPGLRATVVDHNNGEPQEDLRLMSACRSFVTANSSFSWWAAWLCARAGKRVVAPKKWFAGLGHDTGDLVPVDWIRI